MEKIDGAIAALAVVAVVGSGIGLLTYQEDVVQAGVTFPTETATVGTRTETLDPDASRSFTFQVDLHNLTEVRVDLSADPDGAVLQPQTVTVELEGPGGETATDSDETGVGVDPGAVTLRATHAFEAAPDGFSTEGSSLMAIRMEVSETHTRTEGTGDWTVTATISGGAAAPNTVYSVEATLRATVYRADVAPSTPGPGPL